MIGDPRSYLRIEALRPTMKARLVAWAKEFVPVFLALVLQAFGIALVIWSFAHLIRSKN